MKAGLMALGLALALAGCGESGGGSSSGAAGAAAKAPIPAPNGGDWSQTVAETPEGGYRMGNPDAAVKLVEFASISCGHCAEFSEAGSQPLVEQYVKTGNVSWEYRPFMIFPTDPGIFMLLRCRGAGPFFQLTEQLYADQRPWLGRVQQLPQDQIAQLQALPPAQQSGALVRATGLDGFFRQRGMPAAQVDQCLANQADLTRLAEITRQASEQNQITGTPTFMVNGEVVNARQPYWPDVQTALNEALGGVTRGLALLLAAVGASAAGMAVVQTPAIAAPRDWSRSVAATPEGGFRIGNPAARVKLVEYASLTCPHCAEFSTASKTGLANHVRSGRVSFEYRSMILNAADISAALLARCAGPRGFFPLVDRVYAAQPAWLGKASQLMRTDPMSGLSDAQKFTRIAETSGLLQLAGQAGVTPARAKACLVDKAGLARLVAMYQAADKLGVQQTPTFFINGVKTNAHDWAALQPLLAIPTR